MQIREGRFQTLDQCLIREYRMSLQGISKQVSGDFIEVWSLSIVFFMKQDLHDLVTNHNALLYVSISGGSGTSSGKGFGSKGIIYFS